MPDKNMIVEEINLGFYNLEDYEKKNQYFGSTIGRVANRISKAKFNLHGIEYVLEANNGPNNLHGGLRGLDKVIWQATEIQ